MDPRDEIKELLDQAQAAVEAFAGSDDADRLAQFSSHLATCKMVADDLHGSVAAPPEEE